LSRVGRQWGSKISIKKKRTEGERPTYPQNIKHTRKRRLKSFQVGGTCEQGRNKDSGPKCFFQKKKKAGKKKNQPPTPKKKKKKETTKKKKKKEPPWQTEKNLEVARTLQESRKWTRIHKFPLLERTITAIDFVRKTAAKTECGGPGEGGRAKGQRIQPPAK